MKRRRQIILISVFGVLVICLVVCLALYSSLSGRLDTQSAAQRWSGESGERMAQVSVFFPAGDELGEDGVKSYRDTVDAKLLEASVEAPEEGKLYLDAWSTQAEVSIKTDKGSTTATAVGVGGDFFYFHPLPLRSGGYITGNDLMRDRVVLDEEMAWKLYGALDVEGFPLTVNGKPYVVAGVVTREADSASKKANTFDAGIYLPYEVLADDKAMISCYEIVMPDPISGFAYAIALERFTEPVEVIENTGRYGVESIFGVLSSFGDRSIRSTAIAYPYWENAARIIENQLSLLLLLIVLFAIYPLVFVIIALVHLAKLLWRKVKKKFFDSVEAYDEHKYEEYKRNTPAVRRLEDGEHNVKEHQESI